MARVSDFMTAPVVTAKPGDKLTDLVTLVSKRKIKHFPVIEGGRLVGIVTDRDLRSASTHPAVYDLMLSLLSALDRGSVEEIMTRDVVTIRPDMPMEMAAELLREHNIGSLPVVDGGRVVGMVTTTDVLAAFSSQKR
jgi:acetoin utilization protein AcuB